MTRTQFYTATSIDGWIADDRNSLDWLFEVPGDPSGHASRWEAFIGGVGAMCMGSTTYEWVIEHDQLLEHPERWRSYYGTRPCWVFTHRDLPAIPEADIRFVHGDVAPVHAEMASEAGERNIWVVGGGELVGAFADHGLLDEVILNVAPVFLGSGAPLLPRRLTSDSVRLDSLERDGQMVLLTYVLS